MKAERRQTAEAVWLDIAHGGWEAMGLGATRRLYLDLAAGDLRGEDAADPGAPIVPAMPGEDPS